MIAAAEPAARATDYSASVAASHDRSQGRAVRRWCVVGDYRDDSATIT